MTIRNTPGLLDSLLSRAAGGLGLLDAEVVKSAMLDVARDAFIAIDETGMILEWNPAAETMLGWTREEVLGLSMADLVIPEEHRERHRAGIERHLRTGEAPIFGTRIAMQALTREGRIVVELTVGAVRIRRRWVYVASMRRIR